MTTACAVTSNETEAGSSNEAWSSTDGTQSGTIDEDYVDDVEEATAAYEEASSERDDRPPYRVGFNMIRVTDSDDSERFDTVEEVLGDIADMNGGGIRQLRGWDLSWFATYVGGDYGRTSSYDFSLADEMLLSDSGLYPIPTLFQIGNSSAGRYFEVECEDAGSHGITDSKYCKQPYTPSGDLLNVSNDDVAADVADYVRVAAERYTPHGILHYEIGNEWELQFKHDDYLVGFNFKWEPEKYVDLLALSRETLRDVDSDAQVVFGGLSYLDNYETDARQELWEDWLDKVLNHGGADYFDIMNFHYYGAWRNLRDHIIELRELLAEHNADDKPLWLTEVGSSATVTSETLQAQNLIKFFAIAFGNGVELVNWHTHLSSNDGTSNWGGYGTRTSSGRAYLSKYSFQLFAEHMREFSECRAIREGTNGLWAYRFAGRTADGVELPDAIIMWSEDGERDYDLSTLYAASQVIEITEMVSDDGGVHAQRQVAGDEVITLGESPILLIEADERGFQISAPVTYVGWR